MAKAPVRPVENLPGGGSGPYAPPPLRPGKPLVAQVGELFSHRDEQGQPVPGVFMLCDSDTYDAHKGSLAAFLHQPPLNRVWAGDDPANPRWTVLVRFPDQATAALVRGQVAGAGG